jgi:hypothetical protein
MSESTSGSTRTRASAPLGKMVMLSSSVVVRQR